MLMNYPPDDVASTESLSTWTTSNLSLVDLAVVSITLAMLSIPDWLIGVSGQPICALESGFCLFVLRILIL